MNKRDLRKKSIITIINPEQVVLKIKNERKGTFLYVIVIKARQPTKLSFL